MKFKYHFINQISHFLFLIQFIKKFFFHEIPIILFIAFLLICFNRELIHEAVRQGNIEILKLLLTVKEIDVNIGQVFKLYIFIQF